MKILRRYHLKLVKIIKKLWLIFIIFGFVYQSFVLTNNYFTFKIFNKLDVELGNPIPSFTICSQKNFRMNEGMFEHEEFDEDDNINKDKVEKLQIGLGFINYSIKWIENISALAYSGNNSMCISPIMNSQISQVPIDEVSRILIFIFYHKKAYISFHDHNTPSQFISYQDKYIASQRTTSIWFFKRARTLLPFPYSTDCYDYSSELEYKSQKECFFKYISEKELQVCKYNYYWNKRYFNITEERFQFIEYENKCHFNISKFWLKNKCKIDCEINEYFLKQLFYQGWGTSSVYTEIHVHLKYHIHTTYVPKINLVDYLSTFGGLLSMWLGFHMWKVVEKLAHHLIYLVTNNSQFIFPHNITEILIMISKLLVILATFYHIYHLLDNFIYSNRQIIIQNNQQIYFPKLFLSYESIISYEDYVKYYPDIILN